MLESQRLPSCTWQYSARANVYHTVQHIVPLMLVYIITYIRSSSPKEYTPSHNIYTYIRKLMDRFCARMNISTIMFIFYRCKIFRWNVLSGKLQSQAKTILHPRFAHTLAWGRVHAQQLTYMSHNLGVVMICKLDVPKSDNTPKSSLCSVSFTLKAQVAETVLGTSRS